MRKKNNSKTVKQAVKPVEVKKEETVAQPVSEPKADAKADVKAEVEKAVEKTTEKVEKAVEKTTEKVAEKAAEVKDTVKKTTAKAAKAAKTTPAALVEKIEHMMAEIKALNAENESLKSKAAKEALGDVMDQVVEVKGVKLLATSVAGVDMNGLRDLGDQLKGKLGEGVVVLASEADGKVNLVAMATEEAMKKGAHAGNLIKAIAGKVGGGGGGRPNMAQAGGKNPAGIPDAVAEAKAALENQIK